MSVIPHPTLRREEIPLRWPSLTTRRLVGLLLIAYRGNGVRPFVGPDADELRAQVASREMGGVEAER